MIALVIFSQYFLLFYKLWMKHRSFIQTVGVWLLALVLALVWYEAYHAYMINHTYYYDMMANGSHRWIIFWMLVSAMIPVWTLLWKKSCSPRTTGIALWIGLIVSSFAHTSLKWWLWWGSGTFFFLFNTLFLLALIVVTVWWLYMRGAWLYQHIIRRSLDDRSDVLLSLGTGLATFVTLNYLLIFLWVFYPVFAWLQIAWLLWMIRSQPSIRQTTAAIIDESIQPLRQSSWESWIMIGLLVLTIVYIYIGFNLAFIPYSTAWDANHAYMYVPKVMAQYHGMIWWWITSGANVRMAYIAFRFSLMKPLAPWFTLAPDTVAVVMNFISGPLSLLFWLWALRKVLDYIMGKWYIQDKLFSTTVMSLWWMYFLLWLMSGMGAFLVFVDNKTDLGVMSLTMLALLSGFIFLQRVEESKPLSPTKLFDRGSPRLIYALISWLFFALATMAKPTAFQDILIFGLFTVGVWMGVVWLVWWLFFVLAILAQAETMSIVRYIGKKMSNILAVFGIWWLSAQALLSRRQKSRYMIKPLAVRWGSIILALLVLKWPYLVIQQWTSDTVSASWFVKQLLMWYVPSSQISSPRWSDQSSPILVADTGEGAILDSGYTAPVATQALISPAMCTLSTAGLTQDTLYSGMAEVKGWGLVEDLGRYIGFGQRTFTPMSQRNATERQHYSFFHLWYSLLRIFFPRTGCYSNDDVADRLCTDKTLITQLNERSLRDLMNQISSWSRGYVMLSGVMDNFALLTQEIDTARQNSLRNDITKTLQEYMTSNVVEVQKIAGKSWVSIAIPYAYLTPLNVIFNWSLQNLSSYYTDIGFVWILSLVLLLVGSVATVFRNNKKLFVLHIATLAGWFVRWFIASGIIWYAVGLIARTIFSNVLFVASLVSHQRKSQQGEWSGYTLLWILLCAALIQMIFNLIRIASQWWWWPFVWYKWNTAQEVTFEFSQSGIGQKTLLNNSYRAQDVFDLQFGNYNPFLDYVRDRADEDGVLIAGTYLQYFLENQKNIISDGLLWEFWRWWSEWDICTLALRMKDKHIKYLVIDPNIWSVVMGDGNSTLFDRFLAKIDSTTNKIVQHGTMSMLAQMTKAWYLKLINTNNLWSKYAYTLTDDELRTVISSVPDVTARTFLEGEMSNDPLLLRSKLAVPRFFGQDSNYYYILIATVFQQRLAKGVWIQDLADILGQTINLNTLGTAAQKIVSKTITPSELAALNTSLTKGEKMVLWYYLSLVQLQQSNNTQEYQQMFNSLLQQSLWWGSQLMTFELMME